MPTSSVHDDVSLEGSTCTPLANLGGASQCLLSSVQSRCRTAPGEFPDRYRAGSRRESRTRTYPAPPDAQSYSV